MKLKPRRYAESLLVFCKGKSQVQIDRLVKEFLELLGRRGLSRMGTAILESLRDAAIRQSGGSRVTLTTAHELEKSERENFEKILYDSFGKKSAFAFAIDSRLISGFRIKADDSLIDASLSGRLHSLRDYLKQSPR